MRPFLSIYDDSRSKSHDRFPSRMHISLFCISRNSHAHSTVVALADDGTTQTSGGGGIFKKMVNFLFVLVDIVKIKF